MSPLFADTVLEVHAKLISCAIRKMPGMKLSQNYMLKLVLILAQGSGFPMLLFIGGWGGVAMGSGNLCHAACRILIPQPGIEPGPRQWKRWDLTTELPGNSLPALFWRSTRHLKTPNSSLPETWLTEAPGPGWGGERFKLEGKMEQQFADFLVICNNVTIFFGF